ncbi:MAG: hypothetical protein ACPG32_11815 [Akkermansiaceae bacterium]
MKIHTLMNIAMGLACTVWAHAADYLQPDFSKELFKIEKVPLKVDRMKELSRHLMVMAQRKQDTSPQARRTTAQLLAIASRLDPMNQQVKEIDKGFAKGATPASASTDDLQRAQARVRFFNRWLGSEDAGKDANLLSAYLTDATSGIEGRENNTADWTGVVPPLQKYGGQDAIAKNTSDSSGEPPMTTPDSDPKPDDQPKNTPAEPENPNPSEAKFHIAELSLRTPLFLSKVEKYRGPDDFQDRHRVVSFQGITPVQVKVSESRQENRGGIRIDSIARSKDAKKYDTLYKALTETTHSAISSSRSGVPNYQAHFKVASGSYSQSNRLSLTAPMAMMLEASLANTPLRGDICVAASISSDGKFHSPANFWQQLSILRKESSGGRLIVSNESASLVSQLLVYGEHDFFTRWEVIGVDDLAQAVTASQKQGGQNHNQASQLFGTIQDLTKKSAVTKLAVNRAVRKRLAEIVKLSPNHMSAKALLLLGSTDRPKYLNKKTLAYELYPVIQKINRHLYLMKKDDPSVGKLRALHDEARKVIDPLERLVERDDKERYERVLSHANDIRRYMVLARRIDNSDDRNEIKGKSSQLHRELLRENHALLEALGAIIEPNKKKESKDNG